MNEAQLAEVAKLLQETDNVEACWDKINELLQESRDAQAQEVSE